MAQLGYVGTGNGVALTGAMVPLQGSTPQVVVLYSLHLRALRWAAACEESVSVATKAIEALGFSLGLETCPSITVCGQWERVGAWSSEVLSNSWETDSHLFLNLKFFKVFGHQICSLKFFMTC